MKCEVKRGSECSTGNHLFIVTRWILAPNKQEAGTLTCQKCLLSLEGDNEIRRVKGDIDARHAEENSRSDKASSGSKVGKGADRAKQDPER